MQTFPQRPRRRNRRGVSLIEILVVLAILVVGILAIIRLFPSGFFSIESVGNTALADTIGSGELGTQSQDAAGLPEAILAISPTAPASLTNSQYSSSDMSVTVPDFSQVLDLSRKVQNETITVPARKSANPFQCVYVVNYSPIQINNNSLATSLLINSTYWQDVTGDSTLTSAHLDHPAQPQVDLSDEEMPGQQRILVDYTRGEIALPYAKTFTQTFTLLVVGSDDKTYTLAPVLPHSGAASPSTNEAQDTSTPGAYYPDTHDYYNGNWFVPTDMSLGYDTISRAPPLPWKQVIAYRPFVNVANVAAFTDDPYQYTMASPDIAEGGVSLANLGAVAFNPLAAGSVGIKPLKARLSYFTQSWRVLHEDRDLLTSSGTGGTVTRLTLKNLKKVGDPQSDNTIYAGLIPGVTTAANQKDILFLDLDTGQPLTTAVNDEDANGTVAADVNVSYATGRVTFPAGTTASRVRIFYAGDQDWTVAVQKAPDVYVRDADVVAGADPAINAGQCAFGADPNNGHPCLFFPRCDAGKTVEVDGLVVYDTTQKAYSCPNVTVAIGDVPVPLPAGGPGYVEVDLKSTITSVLGTTAALGTSGATAGSSPITTTAVRGLSARAVVAWTERGRWKIHVVDTILTHPQ